MNRRTLIGAAGAASVAVLTAAEPALAQKPDAIRLLGDYVADLAAKDQFSGSLLLTYRGRPMLSRSYGMANKALSIPNGRDTIFALASVTKLFTAVAVAQLVQQGKVRYHERLGTYLSGFPAEIADNVTVHHLLTHTSGFGDHHMTPGFWEKAASWTTVEQVMGGIMAVIRQNTLAFVPGSRSQYSNTGYHLLGAIVAAVSGQSYHDYVRQHVFQAAGMTLSGFYDRDQWRDDRRLARPYQKLPSGERVDIYERRLFIGTPAGDAFSTCADMDRFARALIGENLLNHAFTQITIGGKVPLPGGGMFQSYGPIGGYIGDKRTLGHGGGSPGVSTAIDMYPDSGWNAVVLSNYDAGTVQPIAAMIRKLILG